jgi:pyruvate/2-oxoglutarate dehydrogenase complex dihydrolipoamide dehydrogenase (E3) component
MVDKFDIAVIGGGSAGLFAASTAVNQKARTCLIEKNRLGGDCTWFGCMPSKTLLRSASVAHLFKTKNDYGLKTDKETVLIADDVLKHVRSVREKIGSHETPDVFEAKGIKVFTGSPEFKSGDSLEVNGETITAKKFIICTGSHPIVPPIQGLNSIGYLTNETLFELDDLPESMIILGGGPIGIEIAQAFLRLGVKISVVEMMDKIMFREDRELVDILEKRLKSEGLDIYSGQKAVRFEEKQGKVYADIEDKQGKTQRLAADKVLVAVGRAPNIAGLNLDNAGVEYTDKSIKVNPYLQTTNKNIFACGDVASPYQFSHVAAYTAYLCVRNAMFKKIAWSKADYGNVPWATFTDPEIARVGLTEKEAEAKFGKNNIRVYKNEYSKADRAITDLAGDGLLKIVIDKKGLLIGAHIAGKNAGEIIQGLLIAKSLKIPVSKLAQILFIYPTLSELIKKTAAQPLVESLNKPILKKIISIMKNK